MPTERPCPRCGGKGTIPLAPWLEDVLRLIRVSAKTPGYIADKLGISASTANNRLHKLVSLGLVERGREVPVPGGGRTYLYRKSLE